MVDYEAMGRRIKIMRHERRMSQEQVAKKINISLSYYGNIEWGNRIPGPDTPVDIANAPGVWLDHLPAECVDAGSPEDRRTVRNYSRQYRTIRWRHLRRISHDLLPAKISIYRQ